MPQLSSIANSGIAGVTLGHDDIASAFPHITVIENGIERKTNSSDLTKAPDVFIILGLGIEALIKDQLINEIIRKDLNAHLLGDGNTELSLTHLADYRKTFPLGDAQGLIFSHADRDADGHTVFLGDEGIPTTVLNHTLRTDYSQHPAAKETARWTGLMNYFCCQSGKLRDESTFTAPGFAGGLSILHSSGKSTSLDVAAINAHAVLDYLGDCKATHEPFDPYELMSRIADVSGESLTLTGLPSGQPLLLRAPKKINEALPLGMFLEIQIPSAARRNRLLSGHYADTRKFTDIRKNQLERSKQHLNKKIYSLIVTRLFRGNGAEAIRILKKYPEAASRFSGRSSLVHLAIDYVNDSVPVLEALRSAGADFKAIDPYDGGHVLHEAIANPESNALKKLLEWEPTLIDTPDKQGFTPLQLALRLNNQSAAIELIRQGARIDLPAPGYPGLLHQIVATGNPDQLQMVLNEVSVDECRHLLDAKDSLGNTALHQAAEKGLPEMVDLLLQAGAKPRERNHEGSSPLALARMASIDGSTSHDEVINRLATSRGNRTPLQKNVQ